MRLCVARAKILLSRFQSKVLALVLYGYVLPGLRFCSAGLEQSAVAIGSALLRFVGQRFCSAGSSTQAEPKAAR